jgi:hypothetical protein
LSIRPRRRGACGLVGLAALAALAGIAAGNPACAEPAAEPPAAPRIEARSADFLAVGIVRGDRLSIHLSRVADNAPVHDAVVTVLLRGSVHPTTAEADGAYTLQTEELRLPGPAAVEFQVKEADLHETLKGGLVLGAQGGAKPEERNGARQLGWWVLNFAVCIGFLMLWSRRRKSATAADPED